MKFWGVYLSGFIPNHWYRVKRLSCWVLVVLVQLSRTLCAEQNIEDIVVVALSPLDRSTVVQFPDQSMQVLKPGDFIRGTELSLTQVLTDKLVLEQVQGHSGSNGQSRIVWLHRLVNGTSEVEYPEILE